MFSGLDVAQAHTRRWTALTSFTLQAALVAAMAVYPLLKPGQLSDAIARGHIFVPSTFGDVQRPATQPQGHASGHALTLAPIVVQRGISFHPTSVPATGPEIGGPPTVSIVGSGPDAVPFSIPTNETRPVLDHNSASQHVFRTSSMLQGMLVHRIEPRYPPIAIAARVEGPVVIKAIISRAGTIEQAELISGSLLLGGAALEAVREWRYKPYILNGDPVEVETQITVNFVLGK